MKEFQINQDGGYSPGREDRWALGIKLILKSPILEKQQEDFRILDVGCGDGSFFRFLKARAAINNINLKKVKYVGFDSDPRYKRKVENIAGRFVLGDATDLSALDKEKKFDVIIASDIIEHIDDTDKFITELKTKLKPKGLLYLTTPNLSAWHCRLMLLLGFQPLPTEVSRVSSTFGKGAIGRKNYGEGTIHHIRVFTYRALNEFVRFHKFDIVKAVGGGYRKIDNILFRNKLIGLAPFVILILKNRSGGK